jgi:hypothetical protein
LHDAQAPEKFAGRVPVGGAGGVRFPRCDDERCRGHEIGLLDWEAGAAYLKWRRLYAPGVLEDKIRQRWFTEIAGPQRDLHFFVGNLHKRPHQFMLLGAFYPPHGVMDRFQLF